jgi:hypothetical protein
MINICDYCVYSCKFFSPGLLFCGEEDFFISCFELFCNSDDDLVVFFCPVSDHICCCPAVVSLLKSYLSNRKQQIKVNSVLSDWADIQKGVPQGSILEPLLFNVFINDINIKV